MEDGGPNSDQHHNPKPECHSTGNLIVGDDALDDSHGNQAPEGHPNSQHHNPEPDCCGDGVVGDGALYDSPGGQAPKGCGPGDQMAGNQTSAGLKILNCIVWRQYVPHMVLLLLAHNVTRQNLQPIF